MRPLHRVTNAMPSATPNKNTNNVVVEPVACTMASGVNIGASRLPIRRRD
jgi:hypothetical protein